MSDKNDDQIIEDGISFTHENIEGIERLGGFISVICPKGIHKLFDEYGNIKVCKICEYHLFHNNILKDNIVSVSSDKTSGIKYTKYWKKDKDNINSQNNIFLSCKINNYKEIIRALKKNLICLKCASEKESYQTTFKLLPINLDEAMYNKINNTESIIEFAFLKTVMCKNCNSFLI